MTTTIRCLVRTLATRVGSVGVDEHGQIDVRPLALVVSAMTVLLTGWIAVLGSI